MIRRCLLIVWSVIGIAGCPGFGSPPEPSAVAPTWDNQVAALMAERCAICHTDPPVGGAPMGFRFDKYTTADIDDGGLLGTFEMLERIEARAVTAGTMPPGGGLPADLKLVLDEWISTGAPRSDAMEGR